MRKRDAYYMEIEYKYRKRLWGFQYSDAYLILLLVLGDHIGGFKYRYVLNDVGIVLIS